VSRTVAGCTSRTVELHREVLGAFRKGVNVDNLRNCTLPVVQAYLTTLRERVNPTTVHVHYGRLRAFFAWCA
jgi:hypothetical protein